MNNKNKGSKFENFMGNVLAYNGFWAHVIQDKKNGQPFDIIAAKNGKPYVFDCKECESNTFRLSRMEPNQISAMNRWLETGNEEAFFMIKFCRNYHIYAVPFRELNERRLAGVTSMTEEEIKKVCIAWF